MPASRVMLSQDGPEPSPEALLGALAQVDALGSLLQLVPDRIDRLELTKSLVERGLIAFNRPGGAYVLTAAGRVRLQQQTKPAAAAR